MTTWQKIRALQLWRHEKLDTYQIACRLHVPEWRVYNTLASRFPKPVLEAAE